MMLKGPLQVDHPCRFFCILNQGMKMRKVFGLLSLVILLFLVAGCDLLDELNGNGDTNGNGTGDIPSVIDGDPFELFELFERTVEEWDYETEVGRIVYEGEFTIEEAQEIFHLVLIEDGVEHQDSLWDFTEYGFSDSDFPNGQAYKDNYEVINIGFSMDGNLVIVEVILIDIDVYFALGKEDYMTIVPAVEGAELIEYDEGFRDLAIRYKTTMDKMDIYDFYMDMFSSDEWTVERNSYVDEDHTYYGDEDRIVMTVYNEELDLRVLVWIRSSLYMWEDYPEGTIILTIEYVNVL